MHRLRSSLRRPWRCPYRRAARRFIRTRWRAPDDLADAIAAFRRVVRLQRELAKLAPSFFDAAVVQRERENRDAQRQWMAAWEPCLEKVYGKDHAPSPPEDPYPRLPHSNTQRAVNRRLADLAQWLAVGGIAMDRHRHRRPHGLMSLRRMAQLLKVAFDLKKMVLGLDSPNQLPDKIEYDYEWTDLKRAYGHQLEPVSPVPLASGGTPTPVAEGGDGALRHPFPVPSGPAPPLPGADSPPPRCDAYSRLARQLWSRSN